MAEVVVESQAKHVKVVGVGSRHRRGEVCRSTGLRIERLDKSSRIVVVGRGRHRRTRELLRSKQ